MVALDFNDDFIYQQELAHLKNTIKSHTIAKNNEEKSNDLAEILFITSYPPRNAA